MPEAPEVQNVLDTLQKELQGHQIVEAKITHPRLADNMEPQAMCTVLQGQHFMGFRRHGKFLILEMDDVDWICHLRMEGKFLLIGKLPEEEKTAKHIHAIFELEDGRKLCYYDTRKFGRMQVFEKVDNPCSLPVLAHLGKDVLDPQADGAYLYQKIHKRNIPIKTALLNQDIVAGIGNIYADEILFAARIHPASLCRHLEEEDCSRIMEAAHTIIAAGIEAGGTTIRTFSYGHGQSGTYQKRLKVHAREHHSCLECGTPIIKETISQRSTYLCPSCQVQK